LTFGLHLFSRPVVAWFIPLQIHMLTPPTVADPTLFGAHRKQVITL
jgi:hypothetical protein